MILPKKSLGQHFLKDRRIVAKIVDAAGINTGDQVLEIGPGKGILTLELARRAGKVYTVELDHRLVQYLKNELLDFKNITLIEGDILKVPLDFLPSRVKVVANIPYQISSPLLDRLFQVKDRIESMTLMVQKEVADRILASPGTKDYGPLSVAAQFHAKALKVMDVGKHAFFPPPKVVSSVIRLTFFEQEPVPASDKAFFFKVVKAGFAHRRKSARNSMRDEGFSVEEIDRVFMELELPPLIRAETFDLRTFARIADKLLLLSR